MNTVHNSFLLFLIGVSIQFSHGQNSLNTRQSVVIATYTDADNTRIKNLEPFASHVREVSGTGTEVKSFASVAELLQVMERGEVDVAFMDAFGYLMLKEKTDAYEIGASLNTPKDKLSTSTSVLAVGKNIPVSRLEDVIQNASDFVLFFVSTGSASGNIVPRLKLASLQQGYPERFFLEVQYAGTHEAVIEHALKGEFALCAFESNSFKKLGADTVRLKKLWESPPIPPGPVVFRKSISSGIREELQKILLELHTQNPAAFAVIKTGWPEAASSDRFEPADDSHYEHLLALSNNKKAGMVIIRDFVK